jgi:hypothetical protein
MPRLQPEESMHIPRHANIEVEGLSEYYQGGKYMGPALRDYQTQKYSDPQTYVPNYNQPNY